ncbi:MAG TPA: aldo/keto reductase [Aeriscardovia aeriphila]|uniref:Aldo/keto reductase n=1 Tax=Aeriscardovia aeriphila TaxID=218139 RepID=A0A921KAS1_9BIFI|nr:aldo/keto reductase [Aeriscardovia aeriphila]
MKYAQLGTSGVEASRVALGVMRISEKSPEEAVKIITTAMDCGINFFDTADVYGAGKSSQVLGRALKDAGIARDKVILQTKFGIVAGKRYDFSKKHLLEALDFELNNLGVDYVDFALLHRPDTLVELDQVAEAFNELQNAGKVRHFGVSNVNPWQAELLQSAVDQKLEVNQLQFGLGHTGMVEQEFHVNMSDASSVDHDGGIIAYSRLKKMTIQAWSPFQYGFFEGVFIDNPKFPELNAKLEELAKKYDSTKNGIATAWILRHPAQMQVILGSMNPTRIQQMAAGAEVTLEAQDWYDLYFAAGNDLP